MKILCINTRKGMGDQIIFLPYIQAISEKFKIPVSLLAKDNSKAKDLLEEDSRINEIISLEKEMDGVRGIFKLVNELKKRAFDKVFIFNGWTFASDPSLTPFDHAIYDIQLSNCFTT